MGCGSLSFLIFSLGVERDIGVQVDCVLFWSDFFYQSWLFSLWVLCFEGRDVVWRGGIGSERDKGFEGFIWGLFSLFFVGFFLLLFIQFFYFGKGVFWGGRQVGFFSFYLGLFLQGFFFLVFREVQVGFSFVFGSLYLLVKKDGGFWLSRKVQIGLSLYDRRSLGLEESILDLRY